MKRTGLAAPDDPDDGDDGRWWWHGGRIDLRLVAGYSPTGSLSKQTILRSLESGEIDIVVPYRSDWVKTIHADLAVPCVTDWVKTIDLDVVKTTNYDRLILSSVSFPIDGSPGKREVHQVKTVPAVPGPPPWYARISPQRLTGIAVFIAGRERAVLGEEWRTHLSGKAAYQPSEQQAIEAAGFVRAALKYRVEDAEDWLWESVDAVLGSRWMSSLFVLLAMVGIAVVFIRQGGLYGLADNIGGVAVVFGTAVGVIHFGRKVRDVRPPERKPRRRKKLRRLTLTAARVTTLRAPFADVPRCSLTLVDPGLVNGLRLTTLADVRTVLVSLPAQT